MTEQESLPVYFDYCHEATVGGAGVFGPYVEAHRLIILKHQSGDTPQGIVILLHNLIQFLWHTVPLGSCNKEHDKGGFEYYLLKYRTILGDIDTSTYGYKKKKKNRMG